MGMQGVSPTEGPRKRDPIESQPPQTDFIPPKVSQLPEVGGHPATVSEPATFLQAGEIGLSFRERQDLFLPLIKSLGDDELPQDYLENVARLADRIVEDQRDDFHSEMESFDSYAARKKADIHHDLIEKGRQFLHGFQHVGRKES